MEVEFIRDLDDPEDNSFDIKFTYTNELIEYEFIAYDWRINQIKWTNFINAYNNADEGSLVFNSSNGDVSIYTKNGKTYFSVAKMGVSGAGDSVFSVPNELCVAVFTIIQNELYAN